MRVASRETARQAICAPPRFIPFHWPVVHGLSTPGAKLVDKGITVPETGTLYYASGALWGKVGRWAHVYRPDRDSLMFLGEFEHSVDGKGRIAIPARFRSKIASGAVLTRGVDPCLYVYPMETWEQKAVTLEATITNPRQLRYVERHFFGGAYELELDAQGRIVLPARFRAFAGLNGVNGRNGENGEGRANGASVEAIVIGARERFEIWSPARWEAYLAEHEDDDLSSLPLPF
jgi:MraZ protein